MSAARHSWTWAQMPASAWRFMRLPPERRRRRWPSGGSSPGWAQRRAQPAGRSGHPARTGGRAPAGGACPPLSRSADRGCHRRRPRLLQPRGIPRARFRAAAGRAAADHRQRPRSPLDLPRPGGLHSRRSADLAAGHRRRQHRVEHRHKPPDLRSDFMAARAPSGCRNSFRAPWAPGRCPARFIARCSVKPAGAPGRAWPPFAAMGAYQPWGLPARLAPWPPCWRRGRRAGGREPVIACRWINRLAEQMRRLPLAERRALPGMSAGRADIILAGLAILSVILQTLRIQRLRLSRAGLRDGLLREALEPVSPGGVTASTGSGAQSAAARPEPSAARPGPPPG